MTRAPIVRRRLVSACWLAAAISFGVWAIAWFPVSRVSALGSHPLALEEFGDGTPVTQVFTSTADGLQAVRVRLTASAPADVRLEYRVSTRVGGDTFVERYRASRAISGLDGGRWVTLEFLPLDRSAGASIAFELRALRVAAPDEGESSTVSLMASRDRPLRQSYLLVDGRERWGSLQFEAQAAGDTVLGRFRLRARDRLPAWSWQPVTLAAALGLYAMLFLAVIAAFRTDALPAPAPRRLGMGVAVSAVLVAALAAVEVIARTEHGRIDLVDELYAADLQSGWKLHEGFDVLDVEIGTETQRVILALAPSRISWELTVPAGARLQTAVALLPTAWTGAGDGVNFRVAIEQAGRSTDLFARHVDPAHAPGDRRWIPVDLDLSPFAGRPMTLALIAEPSPPGAGPDRANDFAVWGAPTIN